MERIQASNQSIYSNRKSSGLNNIIINGLFMNADNSLLSVATNSGYRIFEAYNFIQVSEVDEFQELIGPLKITVPFYESNLVMFVGDDESSAFPSTQLVIWDDIKKMKIGVILLKEKIIDAKMSKEAIFIMVQNKILIFSAKDLKYIYTIQDVDHFRSQKLSISYNTNPVVLVNIPQTRTNQLKITKFKLNGDNIVGKLHLVITTPFKSIYKYNISKKCDTAIIVGNPKNKVHIYSLIDFELKFCLDSEFEQSKILNISISKKTKFFSILYSDYNFEVYNLSEEKRVNQNCNCMAELLAGEFMVGPLIRAERINSPIKSRSIIDKAKGLFSSAFNKLKGMVFEKNRKSFCKYKFNPESNEDEINTTLMNSLNSTRQINNLSLNELNSLTLVQFDKINEIVRFCLKFIL